MLVLLGLRGSGKSTIGRAAALSGSPAVPFVDLDDFVAQRAGVESIAALWARDGEPSFRRQEAAALREALAPATGTPAILALGGGTPTAPGAIDTLTNARGAHSLVLVYLHAAPEVLRSRLARTDLSRRPALLPGAARAGAAGAGEAGDPLAEIGAVYAARDPLYRRLADHVIDADAPPETVVGRVLSAWSSGPRALRAPHQGGASGVGESA